MYSGAASGSSVRLNKRDKTYVDISLSWEPNPLTGDITTLKDIRAINNSLKNIIMTAHLEMPFDEEFGSQVTSLLFDPVDLATSGTLHLEIRRAIINNEPRVEVENIRVIPYDDRGEFEIFIEYKIVGTEKIFEVSQILAPTR